MKLASAAVVALLLLPLVPSPAQAVAGASTAVTMLPICTERVTAQGDRWSCRVDVDTTVASSGFDVALGFAWIPSGDIPGPDGVAVAFTDPVISCPAAAGASCEETFLRIDPSMTTWAPDTWGFTVFATRLCGGVPCSPADESSYSDALVILRPSSMSISCLPTNPALFTHFTCEALVRDAGGAGVASTPTSPGQVRWPFDDGANQHDWGSCNLIPQATPAHSAACAETLWVTFVEDGDIVAFWPGDADHKGDSATGRITRERRGTDIVPGCPATMLIGGTATCHVEVFDIEWEDIRSAGGQGVDADVLVNSSTPGSGLPTSPTVMCHAPRVPFPDPSTCSFSFSPTTHGVKQVRLAFDGYSIYKPDVAFASIDVLRRATSTVVSCGPGSVPVNSPATCYVNVTDTTFSSAPTGTVSFAVASASPAPPTALAPGGAFGAPTCTLVPEPAYPSSECTMDFTPWLGIATEGDTFFSLRATYDGDAIHDTSAGSSAFKAVRRATTTALACTDDVLVSLDGATASATCAATVADVDTPAAAAPTGALAWIGDAGTGLPGAFPSTTTCALDAVDPYGCDIPAFTPSTIGDLAVTTRYGGDVDHLGSEATDVIRVHAATASVYTGAQAVTVGSSFTASARVASAVASCYQDRPADETGVAFYLDRDPTTGAAGPWQIPGFAGTGAGGKAALAGISTSGWQPGVYLVSATFLGDAWCDASEDQATLVVADPGSVAHGGGWVALNGRTNFAFVVTKVPKSDPPEYRGQFLLVNNGKWTLSGDLTSLVKHDGAPAACSADGTGELSYASVDPDTGATTWLPAIGDPLTSFGIYFEDGGGGKRATDKFGIQIGHVIVSPPEPNALPKATHENAATVRSGDVRCA